MNRALIPSHKTVTGALALETIGLTKRFGGFTAMDQVSMKVAPGTVHALLGENGAGKSTLVKCVAGFQQAELGSILIDEREQNIANPVVARALGIGMVYQHFTLAPGMTVAENQMQRTLPQPSLQEGIEPVTIKLLHRLQPSRPVPRQCRFDQ